MIEYLPAREFPVWIGPGPALRLPAGAIVFDALEDFRRSLSALGASMERARRLALRARRRRRATLARCGEVRPSRLGPPRWKADQVYRRIAFAGTRPTDPRHLVNIACLGIRPRLHRRRAA